MAGFASALIAAVVLGLASNTDGAITTVQLHRKNAKLDRVATRSDRNVVCAPPPTALRWWRPCCKRALSRVDTVKGQKLYADASGALSGGSMFASCGFITVIVVAPCHGC